ncbi:YggS family pyridoxal phosphate-dependent enzyme [Corynebacterium liangguodongii]|uniref:Pyridoxal phosphate homeostasis protein n=1 Tax=Corynebacterium liangguodongii TaxID=2079535 RepID=A0A2S0WF09_9CORY|nr:YggS family pyridoxal phosphate-dependent enzyme [Corynebacterium liangguodongii]AWB84349.1 YggS family pyridoxal phosphate-dependent enzyme [Corynebacterium liangguodongii]PWB99839.1 YggS family pyridoxal phosphate-dependent enzyme [Corynebacterium liangguodongii]
MSRFDELKDNLVRVQARIAAAEEAAGRAPGSVSLVPVSKFHPVDDIIALGQLGVDLVGENREQEARGKAEALADAGADVAIAMIGQIQTKKANAVARWAAEVHSLDSARLAERLDHGVELALERGEREREILPCLVQVSADGDTSRGGAPFGELDALAEQVEEATHLELRGLMVVPPLDAVPAEVFREVRTRADALGQRLGRPMLLSAGMSGDFEEAIACGSDIVRVGTGVFGPRPVG